MKRRGLVAVLAAVMIMASTALCFADDGLKLEKSYPTDGQKNTSIENLGVKLYFNKDITEDSAKKIDDKAVKLIDANGKKVPFNLFFSDKEKGMVLVVADTTSKYKVLNHSKYKLVIGENFVSDDGSRLGEKVEIEFTTINQKMMTTVNMVMMFVMMGAIMVITVKQQKDALTKSNSKDTSNEPFNPYREAKKTGKTVEEVTAEHEKKMQKLAKKNAKNKREPEYVKHIVCADYLTNVYKVKAPAPIRKRNGEEVQEPAKAPKKTGNKKGGKRK